MDFLCVAKFTGAALNYSSQWELREKSQTDHLCFMKVKQFFLRLNYVLEFAHCVKASFMVQYALTPQTQG